MLIEKEIFDWSDGDKANAIFFPILQYSNTPVLQFSVDDKDTRRIT